MVTNTAEETFSNYVRRSFEVTRGEVTRNITQFQYTKWVSKPVPCMEAAAPSRAPLRMQPDHGVPDTTGDMLEFRAAVRSHPLTSTAPIVTHCSAGVGRTGTFITLDRLLFALEANDEANLNVRDVVVDLRRDRTWMVQAPVWFATARGHESGCSMVLFARPSMCLCTRRCGTPCYAVPRT